MSFAAPPGLTSMQTTTTATSTDAYADVNGLHLYYEITAAGSR